MKHRNWITLLAIGPMLVIPLMVVLLSYIVIQAESEKLESSVSIMEQNTIDSVKAEIQSKVNSIVDLAVHQKSVVKDELHDRIQQRVEDAYGIAVALHDRYSPTLPEQEVKSLIIEALRPLTWNDGESFIWILDFDGNFQLAPGYLQHLEGTSIIDFKDATGRAVIKEEIALTRDGGEGFLWDTFTRPKIGTDEQFEQLAFVKSLGFYNWYLGSAEYLDIATKRADKKLLSEIRQLSGSSQNYFFVMDLKGAILLNSARPEWVGLSYKDSGASDTAYKALYKKVLQAAEKPSNTQFIEYLWMNPSQNKVELKLSYVKAVPNSDWIVGSGFYPEDIVRELAPKIIESIALNQKKIDQLLNIAFWVFIISIGVSVLLSLAVFRLLWRYRLEVEEKNKELLEWNEQLEKKVLKRTEALEDINDELEVLARTDCLTGVDNRYSFMKIAEGEIRRSKRFNDTFSLILLDVDNFKKINDQHGHDVGDLVLIELVKVASRFVREVDTLCRFGGEEFIIMLPKIEEDMAVQIAEGLCIAIANHPFEVVTKVTVSLGVASYQSGLTIDELIKKADVALYQAKRSGKNKVCTANEPPNKK